MDDDAEYPLEITYWNEGAIVQIKLLDDSDREVIIRTKDLTHLFNEIKRHLPDAITKLKKDNKK